MDRTPLVVLPPALAEPPAARPVRYLLGVDGGATKTLAAVLDLEHGSIHVGHAGPSNEDAVGAQAAVAALLESADRAAESAGLSTEDIDAAVIAVAGTNTDAIADQVRAARPESWIVVNDVVGAWAAATGAAPGVGVISGTGSNVFGVGPGAQTWRVGGWGHMLGDEGSGFWLGVQSIRAALHDRDASGPPTALGDAAVEFFGVASVEALASWVYTKPLTKGEIAAFAVETARLAHAGDEVARGLFAAGAEKLAAQIATVIACAGLSGAFPVGLIGSTFKAGDVFIGPLTRHVRECSPDATLAIVEMPPAGGSLLLAARACGHTEAVAPDWLAPRLAAAAA